MWLTFWFLTIAHVSAVDVHRHMSNATKLDRSSNELQTTLEPSLAAARETYLSSSSLLYGMLKKLNDSSVTDTCHEHLQMVYEGIKHQDVWAMKVLDSSAQFESGFIFGNNFLLGSLKECQWLKGSHLVTLSKRFMRNMKTDLMESVGPFDLEYNVVYAEHDSPWQIQTEFVMTQKLLQIGLCVPKSCSPTDIWNITQSYFDKETIGFASQYEIQPKVVRVKTTNVETNFFKKTSVRLLGAFLFITLLLTLLSARQKPKMKEVSLRASLLKCFSMKDNFEFILSTKSSAESVPTVNGIKAIGCFLILILHMSYFSHFSVHNPVMVFAYAEEPFYQWVSMIGMIVEMFFTISGLLLSYNFLRNPRNLSEVRENNLWQNFKFFTRQIFHRYLRLTPLYLFTIGATEISAAYLNETSPFWVDRKDLMCQNYWWRNLLYIQNLYPLKEICLTWTWSLACEMQFFIISTFLLFLYAKHPELTKKLFIALFATSTVLGYLAVYTTKLEMSFDVLHELGEMYTSPWLRILPYLIGVGSGWILLNHKHVLNIDKKSSNYLFLVAFSFIVVCHCCPTNRATNRGQSYKFLAPLALLVRIFYSAATAWIILASTTKNSVPIAKFLNHKIFVHLSKLSYGIFLLHPVVIALVYGVLDDSQHCTPMALSVMSIGVSVIVYLLAFVSSLLFEVPYSKISSLLKNYKSKTL